MEEFTESIDITLQHRIEARDVFLIGKVKTKHPTDLLSLKRNTGFIRSSLQANQQFLKLRRQFLIETFSTEMFEHLNSGTHCQWITRQCTCLVYLTQWCNTFHHFTLTTESAHWQTCTNDFT